MEPRPGTYIREPISFLSAYMANWFSEPQGVLERSSENLGNEKGSLKDLQFGRQRLSCV